MRAVASLSEEVAKGCDERNRTGAFPVTRTEVSRVTREAK